MKHLDFFRVIAINNCGQKSTHSSFTAPSASSILPSVYEVNFVLDRIIELIIPYWLDVAKQLSDRPCIALIWCFSYLTGAIPCDQTKDRLSVTYIL